MFLDITFIHWLVLLSVCISLIGATAYIKDTLKGTTKPNRVSQFLWAFAPLLATAAAVSAGANVWATVRVFMSGLMPLFILIASFYNPKSYWKLTLFDYLCGVFSLVAIGFWVLADSPILAILFFAVADGFAAIPTIVKSFKAPETETRITYLLSTLSVVLVIPSIPIWNVQNSAFQIYLLTVNLIIITALYRPRPRH